MTYAHFWWVCPVTCCPITLNMGLIALLQTPKKEDMAASAKITWEMHNDYHVFPGIRCFKLRLSLQVKEGGKPYQAPPRHVAYSLQEPYKKELENLQKQQIILALGVDETSDWCNSFTLLPKPKVNVCQCLDLAKLNQTLIRPVCGGQMV